MPRSTPTTRRRWTANWPALLAIPWLLLAPSCASLGSARKPSPPLPVRQGGPRATWAQVEVWLEAGRVDLIVAELERERLWSDALVRDGEWAGE